MINGLGCPATLVFLRVYLSMSALRGLFIGPSLDALAGLGGEVATGQFDFTLLRPANMQFLASCRKWRPLALLDLFLGVAVLGLAVSQLGGVGAFSPAAFAVFLVTLLVGVSVLYAVMLLFASMVFFVHGILFTWVFEG